VPFIVMTLIGCAIWATTFVLVGLIAASAWKAADSALGRVLLVIGLLTLAGSALRKRHSR
jgi:membrane protein DedA with SNARE-associated domain